MNNNYRDHNLVKEFGEWVAYKSKNFKSMGKLSSSRVEKDDKAPTDIERIVLGTNDYSEACKRLDIRLAPKKKVRESLEGQLRLDQA